MEMAASDRSSQRSKKPCGGEEEDGCTALAPCKKTLAVEMTHAFHLKAQSKSLPPLLCSLPSTPPKSCAKSVSLTHTSLLLHRWPCVAAKPHLSTTKGRLGSGYFVICMSPPHSLVTKQVFAVISAVSESGVASMQDTSLEKA